MKNKKKTLGLGGEKKPFLDWLAMELVPERWIRMIWGRVGCPRGDKIIILSRTPLVTNERHNYAEYLVFTEVR